MDADAVKNTGPTFQAQSKSKQDDNKMMLILSIF